MSEPLNVEGTPAVAVERVVVPPPVDSRQRVITATVTLRVRTTRPEHMIKVAQNRKRDLKDWFDRHWKDIENVGSYCDDMSYEVEMSVENPED